MRSMTYCGVLAVAVLLGASSANAQRASNEDLLFIGKSARLEPGRSVEAAVVIGDDLVVAGNVDGVAAAVGGDLHVLRGARIDGAVLAIGGELLIEDGASVTGPRVQVAGGDFSQVAGQLSEVRFDQRAAPSVWMGPFVRLIQVLMLFVLAVFLVLLAQRHVQNVQQTVAQRPGLAVFIGFSAMLGLIPLCILLALSLIGIPLIPVAIIGIIAVGALGMTGLAAKLGYSMPYLTQPKTLFSAMTRGVLLLAIAVMIPFLGASVLLVASACGIGAVLLSRFGTQAPAQPPERAHDSATSSTATPAST